MNGVFVTVQGVIGSEPRRAAWNGVSKGDRVLVHGKLRVKDYVGGDGVRRSAVELEAQAVGPDLTFAIARVRPVRRPDDAEPTLGELPVAELAAQRAARPDDDGLEELDDPERYDDHDADEEEDEDDDEDDDVDDDVGEDVSGEADSGGEADSRGARQQACAGRGRALEAAR